MNHDDIAGRARRRTAAVLAAAAGTVLVTATAVLGLVVALTTRADREAPAPGPAATTDPRALGDAMASGAPSASKGDLSWSTVAGAKVPVSATAGPRDTREGRARGFAHTPLGAVLAAAHITLRLCPQVGPAVFTATLREQVTGTDAAALRQHLDDDYEQARAQLGLPYGTPAGVLFSTARGYRVVMTGDTASVGLLIEGPGGKTGTLLIALSLQMLWLSDDWVLVAPAGGTWSSVGAVTTDSTGYTRFPDGA